MLDKGCNFCYNSGVMNTPEQQPDTPEVPHAEREILRREAGAEVFGEPDQLLLGFIIARETIIDSLKAAGIHPPVKEDDEMYLPVWDAYRAIGDMISERKSELGIGGFQPPSQE